MKTVYLAVLIIVATTGLSYSDEFTSLGIPLNAEISNFKKTPEPEKPVLDTTASVERGSVGSDISKMKEFLESQQQEQEEIKTISRDIRKYELEIQKRQLINKLSEVSLVGSDGNNGHQPAQALKDSSATETQPVIKVTYLAITGNTKDAIIDFNGSTVLVNEGGDLKDGYKVVKILDDGVEIKDPKGMTSKFIFNQGI